MNLPKWAMQHEGKGWRDMPGNAEMDKKLNFFLFRRNKILVGRDGKFYWSDGKPMLNGAARHKKRDEKKPDQTRQPPSPQAT